MQQSSPAPIQPQLVSTNLKRANGTWVRLCPRWYMTGMPAGWTFREPRLRAAQAQ